MEKCENCGVMIGDLETPCVWHQRVVCAACYGKLSAVPPINLPTRRRAVPIIAIIGFLAAALLYWHGMRREVYEPDSQQSDVQKPAVAEMGFSVERETNSVQGLPATGSWWKVTNQDQSPLIIKSFRLNGEKDAWAWHDLGDQGVPLPATITVGDFVNFEEFQYTFKNDDPNSYDKTVVFIDIDTNRGAFRYRPNAELTAEVAGEKAEDAEKFEVNRKWIKELQAYGNTSGK